METNPSLYDTFLANLNLILNVHDITQQDRASTFPT